MTGIQLARAPQRILIIKPSSLGDVVHALPVLNLLKRKWPSARVSWLVTPACAGLIEGHKALDEAILFERRRLARFWRSPGAAVGLVKLTRLLRDRRFDLVVDLQGLFRSGWLAWRSAAPTIVGTNEARELAWLFHTHQVNVGEKEQHALEKNLSVAEALGCGRGPVEFGFPVDDSDRQSAREMAGAEAYAVLLPGANWPTKRWPAEQFAALVEPLRARWGLKTIVAGGPDAASAAARMAGAADLTCRTTLRQLVALIERAALVIANDSGPMHIAAALGRPLVAIFGPTNPVRTGPYGRPDSVVKMPCECAPCYSRKCSHGRCLEGLAPDTVLDAAGREMRQTAISG